MNRTKTILLILGIFLLAAFSGCDQQSNEVLDNQIEDQAQNVVADSMEVEEPAPVPEFEAPVDTPDPIKGQQIFTENCARCHGPDGLTEPMLVGAQVSSFSSAPILWYETISIGREGSEMAAFEDVLDVQSRWDVLAYIYSLSSNISELRMGKAIFDDTCSECHGTDGTGSGLNEAHMTTDFTDLTIMSMISNEYIYGAITPGIGNDIHVIEGLDDFTRASAASFVRTLSFPYTEEIVLQEESDEVVEEDVIEEEVEETVLIDVEGIVINSVSEEPVSDHAVTLMVLNHMSVDDTVEYEGTTNAVGEYSFSDIEVSSEAIYLVYTDYKEVTYQSDYAGVGLDVELEVFTIEVFEATTDLDNLEIETIEVFFIFHESGTIVVQENWQFKNVGTQTVLPSTDGTSSLLIDLPANVANMGFSEYSTIQQMSMTETGFQIEQPFIPGEDSGYLLFAYEVPYSNKFEWTRTLPLPVNQANAYVPVDTVTISSSDATYIQERMFNNTPFDAYEFEQEDGVLSLTVKGRNPYSESGLNLDQEVINIIIGTALFAVVLVGFILYMRKSKKTDGDFETLSSDEILDQIVALDEAFENGEIKESEYSEERSALKELLQVTLEDDQS
jgi:mono/diheme cytochrome c family protein/uncharacterized membrane protein